MGCGPGVACGRIPEVQELNTAQPICIVYGKSDAGREDLRCNSRIW